MDQELLEAILLTTEPGLEFYAHNGALSNKTNLLGYLRDSLNLN